MSDSEPIIVKVTSTSAFFGEPSIIRVILEKMVPLVVGQVERDVLFFHRQVVEQEAAIVVMIHEAGPQAAPSLIEHYLAQMTNPKLTFVVKFTADTELTDEAHFGQIVASTEANQAFSNFVAHANNLSSISGQSDEYRHQSPDYQEHLWSELVHMKMPWEMSATERQHANYVVDELFGIVGREYGRD